MRKVTGSWSAIRHYLETEMLTKSLKGRIQYACTSYPNMDGCHVFELRVDGKAYKRFSMETVAFRKKNGQPALSQNSIWTTYWKEKDTIPPAYKEEFDDEEFCEALSLYRSLPIGEALANPHPLVRMFAILDRRVGKRTLKRLHQVPDDQPLWLQGLYRLRMEADGIFGVKIDDI